MPSKQTFPISPSQPQHGAVLITGATRRIGRSIALHLAKLGWPIALHVRTVTEDAVETARLISAQGGRAELIPADLSETDEVNQLVQESTNLLGPITCLINNASLFEQDQLPRLTQDLWDAHLNVNLRAPVFLAQSMLEQLPDSTQGNIINIIDQRVWRLTPDFFSYTISKSALWTATRTMAMAMAPRVRVNAIGPGPVLQSIHQTQADFAAEAQSVPLQRAVSPEEIARGVELILDTPSLTGQMIALDGGQHLL